MTDTNHNEADQAPGFGEREEVPGGISVGDAVPEMPPPGGGLTADDTAHPTTMADTTGDRATGLTALGD